MNNEHTKPTNYAITKLELIVGDNNSKTNHICSTIFDDFESSINLDHPKLKKSKILLLNKER